MALIRLCSFDFYLISYLSMLLARQCKSLKMVGIEHMYGKSNGCYRWTIYEIVFSCFSLTKVSHGWPQSKMTLDYQNISHFVLLRVFFSKFVLQFYFKVDSWQWRSQSWIQEPDLCLERPKLEIFGNIIFFREVKWFYFSLKRIFMLFRPV